MNRKQALDNLEFKLPPSHLPLLYAAVELSSLLQNWEDEYVVEYSMEDERVTMTVGKPAVKPEAEPAFTTVGPELAARVAYEVIRNAIKWDSDEWTEPVEMLPPWEVSPFNCPGVSTEKLLVDLPYIDGLTRTVIDGVTRALTQGPVIYQLVNQPELTALTPESETEFPRIVADVRNADGRLISFWVKLSADEEPVKFEPTKPASSTTLEVDKPKE